jgi:signal transduction histidine kinase
MDDHATSQSGQRYDEVQRRTALVSQTLPILLIPALVTIVTFVLLRLTVGDIFTPTLPPDRKPPAFLPLVPIVVIAIFFTALIVLIRMRRPSVAAIVLLGTWTLLTTLGVLRGGVTANAPALLVIPICAAGLLLDRAASLSLAFLATLLVAAVAWLEMSGLGPGPDLSPPFIAAIGPYLAVGFWVGLFWTIAALTSLLTGSLQSALKDARAQAQALSALSAQLEERVAEQTERLLDQEREAATLEERARLARDIHDTLAQGLTGIVVQLGAAQRALSAAPGDAPQHLELAHRLARESLAEARRSVWNLRAPALERADLADALRGLASRPLPSGAAVRFEQRGEAWPLPPDVESALLRVCQEALANVSKHAEASEASVALTFSSDAVRLEVRDDGAGFPPDLLGQPAPSGPWGSFGLLGMRERMHGLGGELVLTNDAGARVVATAPRTPLVEDKQALVAQGLR